MITLYMFRHAEAQINMSPGIISGRSPLAPLTKKGVLQAKALGLYLAEAGIYPVKMYTSPACRAVATALYTIGAMGLHNIDLTVHDALQEMDQGKWSGQCRARIYKAARMVEMERLGKNFKAPGGESMNEVGTRMLQWAHTIVATTQSGIIFAFSHGVAIKCFASTLSNWTQEQTFDQQIANVSINTFAYAHGRWHVASLNQGPI